MNLSENFKKLMSFPSKEEVLKAADKNKATEFGDVAADMALSLTPVGGVAGVVKKATPKIMQVADDFFGMHKSTELGDIVLTKSAKGPGFQLTMFDGKLGSSNTVKDMQFATKEEAIKAFDDMHMGGGISDVKDEVIGRKGFDKDAKEIVGNKGDKTWANKQDAARHLLAVGELARKTTPRGAKNPVFADILSQVYELVTGSDGAEDAQMDKHNNKLALSLFNANSYDEVKERVATLMEDAQYQDFSDKTKPAFLKIDPEESVSPKVDKMDVLLNRLTEALEKSNKPKKIIRDKDGKIVGVE